MEDIPGEIWEDMALNGWISLKDMVALTHTSTRLRSLIRLHGVWRAVLDKEKWQLLRKDYGILPKVDTLKTAFEEAVIHLQRQQQFERLLNLYHFGDKRLILTMLKNYSTDTDILPIIRAAVDSLLKTLEQDISKRGKHDISKLALCANLLLVRHFTLGLEGLLYDNQEIITDDLEQTYFYLSLFDSASYQLIHLRASMLDHIARKINRHLHSYSTQLTEVQVYEREIVFSRKSTYFTFLNVMVQIVFSSICGGNPFYYNEMERSYNPTAEDFSILRIYGKQAKGYYLLLYAILAKSLKDNVFTRYKITIAESNTSEYISITVCNRLLEIGNYCFLYADINDPSSGGLLVKRSEIPASLLQSSFLPFTGAITEFVKARATYNNYITDDREFFFGNNRKLGNLISINNDNFRMIQAVVGAAMGATARFDPMDRDILLDGKCFVYGDALLGILSSRRINPRYRFACNTLYKTLLANWGVAGVTKAMDLAIGNVIPKKMALGRQVGQILGATNSWTIGVVIGYHPHDEDYLCLYTTSGGFEFFKDDSKSLLTIDHLLNSNHDILRYFLDVCAIDVLGLCYFGSFKVDATSVAFVPRSVS